MLIDQFLFDPRWRTSDVVGLARGIIEDGAYERFPIQADALMDAGCEHKTIIRACREGGNNFTWQRYLVLHQIFCPWPDRYSARWLILESEGITPRSAFDALTDLGKVEGFTTHNHIDLGRVTDYLKPLAKTRIIATNATRESYRGVNISTNNLWEQEFQGLTLQARLLLEILVFAYLGDHLDQRVRDRTIGSCAGDGGAPDVCWDPDLCGIHIQTHVSNLPRRNLRARYSWPAQPY